MKYRVIKKQNLSKDCFVCGAKNPFGLKAKFYECEREDGEHVLLTVFTADHFHQSYPGRTHGGITSTILDEAIGRSACIGLDKQLWGVTIDLNIKFRKPVPLEQILYCETKITKQSHRSFEGEGKLLTQDGTLCATAIGKYLILQPDQITAEGVTPENWYYEDGEMPTEFILG